MTRFEPAHRGAMTGGIWLIGLGLIFLAQQLLDIPWSQAWPLFLILAGIAGAVQLLLGFGDRGAPAAWLGWIWPMLLIGLGVLFLGVTTGTLGIGFDDLVAWWPLLLVGIGVLFLIGSVWPGQRGAAQDSVSIDADGVSQADVVVRFGAGELRIGAGRTGKLVEGRFGGGVVAKRPSRERVELSPDMDRGIWWGGERLDWDVRLAPDVELDLRIEGGASRSTLDLRELRVRRLDLKTGASQTNVRLPEHGVTAVRADAGAAQVTFEVPSGVAARIRSQMVVGRTDVDESRFPKVDGGRYESADFATAADRIEIDVRGGMGNVVIR
ncbi:MAG TPA: DUF5668 domain-containing protein [Candidatus Limnocylindria bacterium]|nr:DUF5668 domain-containing protein [Candidatus Limnocylindria bacterium]